MKLIFALIGITIVSCSSDTDNRVRLCVAKEKFSECERMLQESLSIGHNIKCVEGNDRLDCQEKIIGPYTVYQTPPQADVMYAEPEDLLIAYQKNNSTFRVFKQVRTKEEPNMENRYEAIALVRADTTVKSLKDLKGLKSCHTGVGRNAGYRIPFTILTKLGVLKADDDMTLSARESELKAFSQFFSKSCIVGQWSPHPDVNEVMKKKYSNLCAMCEKPEQCDYPDQHSGYSGAIKCVTDGGGDIAFTKVIEVKKFFGLPHDNVEKKDTKYDHTKYRYLCPDGTLKPLDQPACPWAARPWPAFIANKILTSGDVLVKMREDLLKLSEYGENKGASWRKNVLGLEDYNILKDVEPISPLDYLKAGRYYDVLTRQQTLGPFKALRICEETVGFFSSGKCEALSSSAFSRGVRPRIECIHETSVEKCMEAVKSFRADIVFADPHEAYFGMKDYNLKPLMMEKYGNSTVQYLALILPKSATQNSIKDFENKRFCWWTNKKSDYDTALKLFLSLGLIKKECPYDSQMRDFAMGSFGSQTCLTDPTVTVNGIQLFDNAMWKPLVPSLGRDYERYHPEDKFELLCQPSGNVSPRMPLKDVENCHYATIPPRMMLTKESINQLQKDELIAMFTKIGDMYNMNPDWFRFFGDLNKMADSMVSNAATGFEVVKGEVPQWKEYEKLMKSIENCKLEEA